MASYLLAGGAMLAMYGQISSGYQNAENMKQQGRFANMQADYLDYFSSLEANNALWQYQFQAALMGEKARLAGYDAELTFAQAGAMEGYAKSKRGLSEEGVALEESKALDSLATGVSTKKAQMGKSGIRVNTGSSSSFLAEYWNKKANEISSGAALLRKGADLELSNALFSANMTRAKGTIQLDEASLMESQVPYLLSMGDYSAGLIRTKGAYQSALSRYQAGVYGAGVNQSITSGWLNAAGTGAAAGYTLLNKK